MIDKVFISPNNFHKEVDDESDLDDQRIISKQK